MTPNGAWFAEGANAYDEGKPETACPYDRDEGHSPDNYPGRYANWIQGWRVRKWQKEYVGKVKG